MEATDEGSAAQDRRYSMLDPRYPCGGENLKVLERVTFLARRNRPALATVNCFSCCTW